MSKRLFVVLLTQVALGCAAAQVGGDSQTSGQEGMTDAQIRTLLEDPSSSRDAAGATGTRSQSTRNLRDLRRQMSLRRSRGPNLW